MYMQQLDMHVNFFPFMILVIFIVFVSMFTITTMEMIVVKTMDSNWLHNQVLTCSCIFIKWLFFLVVNLTFSCNVGCNPHVKQMFPLHLVVLKQMYCLPKNRLVNAFGYGYDLDIQVF
jgi:hypothetical protein